MDDYQWKYGKGVLIMKQKNENGAIIVEASICFPFFIFAIVMFLSLIDICMTQSKIATSLNVAAKELSEYSYLYILTGANDAQGYLADKSKLSADTVSKTLTGLDSMTSTILSDKNTIKNDVNMLFSDTDNVDINKLLEDAKGIKSDAGSVIDEGKELGNTWKNAISDPMVFMKSMIALAANGGWNEATAKVGSLLAQAFMVKNLHTGTEGGSNYEAAEKFLKQNHILPKNGSYVAGLDFDKTQLFKDGQSERIQLVVKYKIHVVKLFNIDFNFTIQQCALTKAWGTGINEKKN